jgi:predicted transcriptional regulator
MINEAKERLRNAKSALGDIIISFNSQLDRQIKSINILKNRIVNLSSKASKIENNNVEYKKMISRINDTVNSISDNTNIIHIEKKVTALLEELDRKKQVLENLEKELNKIIEKAKQKDHQIIQVIPKEGIESGIIIREDRVLSQLTETELRVLNILTKEKSLTAPEIRVSLGLSREHTARLMKRLYEKGYLDRNTYSIPYLYYIKSEMLEILNKNSDKSKYL